MKALSLKQPWAELILQGKKKIELRKWNTKFRGEFLIHASRNPDEKAMKKFGFDNLVNGAIIGKANLVDAKKYNTQKELNKDKNKHMADIKWGKYGFVLGNIKRIKPIPAKGRLNFWDFNGKIK
jgi:hypothetical protein